MLKRTVKEDVPKRTAPNWRIRGQNFVPKNANQVLERGAVTFSAGWFGQGHTVSFEFCSLTEANSFRNRAKNII